MGNPSLKNTRSYLDGLVLVRGPEGIGPGLDQFEHLLADVLVGR